ncbi:unnamed protein product [Lactuca saligna]|uniref:Uncharacterized protein n=1 Tax=Lactuca saligna TaxID=75948 RepID=A0AA35YHD5_LACSI|nr:unnamed protein product [Lactuca saligna]
MLSRSAIATPLDCSVDRELLLFHHAMMNEISLSIRATSLTTPIRPPRCECGRVKFLRSYRPDHQPPLHIPITSELVGGSEDKISTTTPSLGHDGMSQEVAGAPYDILEEVIGIRDGNGNGIILIGEIGGTAEEDATSLIKVRRHLISDEYQGHETSSFKSNFASWSAASVPEETRGKVAAIASGGKGRSQDKIRTLRDAGVIVVESPAKIAVAMLEMETEGHEVVETLFLDILATGGKGQMHHNNVMGWLVFFSDLNSQALSCIVI